MSSFKIHFKVDEFIFHLKTHVSYIFLWNLIYINEYSLYYCEDINIKVIKIRFQIASFQRKYFQLTMELQMI